MSYLVLLDDRAVNDIQYIMDYYDFKQSGLGDRFKKVVDKYFSALSIQPYFQIKYDSVHCLPIKKWPYMIHFTVDKKNKKVYVRAVVPTKANPDKYWLKQLSS